MLNSNIFYLTNASMECLSDYNVVVISDNLESINKTTLESLRDDAEIRLCFKESDGEYYLGVYKKIVLKLFGDDQQLTFAELYSRIDNYIDTLISK